MRFEKLPVAVWEADANGRLLFLNPVAKKLFGRTLSPGYKNKSLFDFILEEFHDQLQEYLNQVFQGNSVYDVCWGSWNGTQYYQLSSSLVPTKTQPGQVRVRGFTLIAPTSKSALVEQLKFLKTGAYEDKVKIIPRDPLETTQTWLSHIIHSDGDALFLFNLSSEILLANKVAVRMLGYEEQEIIGKLFLNFIAAEDIEKYQKLLRSFIELRDEPLPRSIKLELKVVQKNKGTLQLDGSISPFFDGQDWVILAKFCGEEVLCQSRVQLLYHSFLLNSVRDAMVALDDEYRIQEWNSAAEKLFGWSADEVIGKKSDLIIQTTLDHLRMHFREQVQTQGFLLVEGFVYRRDGTLLEVEISASQVKNNQGQVIGIVVFYRDISERKILEQRLHESKKVEALGQLTAAVAHEINNPLAGIKNAFALLKGAISKTYPYYSYVARLDQEIDRTARIVQRMQEFYDNNPAQFTLIVLHELVTEELTRLSAHIKVKELLVSNQLAPTLIVFLPGTCLQRILRCLIQNAIEASPQAGSILISGQREQKFIKLDIVDFGPGIAPEIADHIFKPFFSTKTAQGTASGAGLGLSLAKTLALALGGDISFTSETGHTTFTVSLPCR